MVLYHSNETFLEELLHSTICHLGFYKTNLICFGGGSALLTKNHYHHHHCCQVLWLPSSSSSSSSSSSKYLPSQSKSLSSSSSSSPSSVTSIIFSPAQQRTSAYLGYVDLCCSFFFLSVAATSSVSLLPIGRRFLFPVMANLQWLQ